MVMNMRTVNMRRNDKSIIPLCPPHRGFISDSICFFRSDFPGFKRLSNLVGNNITRNNPTCDLQILSLGCSKFSRYGFGVTHIAADQFTACSFLFVLCIVRSVFQTLLNRFSFVLMHGNQSGRSHMPSPLIIRWQTVLNKTFPSVLKFPFVVPSVLLYPLCKYFLFHLLVLHTDSGYWN